MKRVGGAVLGKVLEQAQEVEQEAGLVRQQEVQNHAGIARNGLKVIQVCFNFKFSDFR